MSNSRVYAEIDLNSIMNNTKEIRNVVGSNIKIMAVVKADGYGHGAVITSKAIADDVDAFAVATIEEAIELRKGGIEKEILILGYISPDYYAFALEYDISLTVYSFETAKKLSDFALKNGQKLKIHIAIDTGMGRIGFYPDLESIGEIKKISNLSGVVIEGVFSHFSTADEADKTYSNEQIEKYNGFMTKLEDEGVLVNTKHICNSAGIMELPKAHFDMVRMGIIMYGYYPSNAVDKSKIRLEPAMSIKSSVIHIKTISKGEFVSYGRHFKAEKETVVATIPIGYADGYPRLLSSKGRVIINGKYAKVIGNVCMDLMMVDITGIEDVSVGDDVVIIGKMGDCEITVEEIAELSGTINYEIICGIGKRVPRIYKKGELDEH